MLLISYHEPSFIRLVQEIVPSLAKLEGVQAAMKKYTSGYLTRDRLGDAMKIGTEPMIMLATFEKPINSAEHERGLIKIGTHAFKGYKDGHPTYVRMLPVTVLHEVAHWGYWKGQLEGHPSDEHGRKHQNDDYDPSPLNPELERVIFTYFMMMKPRLGQI